MITKTVSITETKRLQNSPDGNPSWRVHLSDGSAYRTATNADCAYGLVNAENKGWVEVTIESGEIIDIVPTVPALSDCPWYDVLPRQRPWWAQRDCEGRMIEESGLCEGHHNAQPELAKKCKECGDEFPKGKGVYGFCSDECHFKATYPNGDPENAKDVSNQNRES